VERVDPGGKPGNSSQRPVRSDVVASQSAANRSITAKLGSF
jgi:hypothetical protein